MPPMQVMKISGHTQMTTFTRYVNTDGYTARNVAAALDAFQAQVAVPDLAEIARY